MSKKKPKLKCTLNFLLQDKLQFGMSVFFALTLLESSKLVIEWLPHFGHQSILQYEKKIFKYSQKAWHGNCVYLKVHSTQKRTQITNQIKLAQIKNP